MDLRPGRSERRFEEVHTKLRLEPLASIKRERIGTLPQVNSYVENVRDARTQPQPIFSIL